MQQRTAIQFVILIGIVSLFADMTYEGARSITGQYLAVLGASGTIVGLVAGFGELLGYGFRLVSGYISDRTGKYWMVSFLGYLCNLFAVPFLALAGNWQMAAALILLERFGRAIRTPARDAMLSYATKETGRGWGFGLHEALDQTGAIIGPLIVSYILYQRGSYQESFAILLIPALCSLSVLTIARLLFPHPQKLEVETKGLKQDHFTKKFWLYVAATSCVAAGYADFALIAYHFKKAALLPDIWIPVLFSIAMGVAGASAFLAGWLYDRLGLSVLMYATGLSALFAPLVFSQEAYLAFAGMVLWGLGLGTQESVMQAFVADLVPKNQRGTAYGTLNIWFGIFWFLGSALMGYLYDTSLFSLVIFSLLIQLASLPILVIIKRL